MITGQPVGRRRIVAVLATASLFASCDRAVPTSPTATLAIRNFALNLDPATLADVESRKIATMLYTGLVAVDADGTIRPRVAASWRRLDSLTWEFRLAKNLTFTDGSKITSEHVISSLCEAMQSTHIQSWSLRSIERALTDSGRVKCTGLAAPAEDVVTIREALPTPSLFDALAGPGGWIVDYTPSKKGAYGVRPGTGPYTVASVVPDQRVVLERRVAGAAVSAKLDRVQFDYIPDDAIAAARFVTSALDLIEIDSPLAADAVMTDRDQLRRSDANLVRYDVDRVRIVLINTVRLRAKGMSARQIDEFLQLYSDSLQRDDIAKRTRGLAIAMPTAFPPHAGPATRRLLGPINAGHLPSQKLTLLTENDQFSDLIAALSPTTLGSTHISYRAIEKGLYLSSLLRGDFDLALVKLEATHHTPKFWTAFFTPGDPYTVFGRSLAGLDQVDVYTANGASQVASRIDREGNWVGVLREKGAYAAAADLTGIRLTASGQLSFEEIGRR